MPSFLPAPNLQLPWSSSNEDGRRFWRILGFLLIPFVIFSIAIPLIHVPEATREELEKLPPQLARVVLEEQEIPEPPPPPEPTPQPTAEPEKEEEKPEEEEPPEEEPKIEDPEPEPEPEPEPAKLVEAREAAEAEINQFADALSEMRDAFDLSDVGDELTQSTGEAEEIDRAIISAGAKTTSGGIDTSKLSRDTGGVALSGKTSTKVSNKLASANSKLAQAKGQAGKSRKPGDKTKRSDESIRKTMGANKSAIFAIYNRALRKNPSLEGKVVFKIVIEPNGKVSGVSIVSSDLEDPALERKLLSRIRLINFGVFDVVQTTVEYALDFLPY